MHTECPVRVFSLSRDHHAELSARPAGLSSISSNAEARRFLFNNEVHLKDQTSGMQMELLSVLLILRDLRFNGILIHLKETFVLTRGKKYCTYLM